MPERVAVEATARGGLATVRAAALRGFGNLYAKESRAWTRTRSWWLQPVVWTVVLVGPLLLPLRLMRDAFAAEGSSVLAVALEMFFTLAALAPAVGAVLLMQGSVVAERQLGTAAWVLSKPVGRTAFLLAKLAANALALLLAALLLPGLAAYALLSVENGAPLPAGPFLGALALDAVAVLFYLTLTLSLGALVDQRGVVLAVPLAILLGGDLVLGFLPGLSTVTPWVLGRYAAAVAAGAPLPSALPVVATLGWCALLLVAATWRFGREDL